MSGGCDRCGEHSRDCICEFIEIDEDDFIEIWDSKDINMIRRLVIAEGRFYLKKLSQETESLNNNCPVCGEPSCYSEKWDSIFCNQCNVWLEECCGDPKCRMSCHSRPVLPIETTKKKI